MKKTTAIYKVTVVSWSAVILTVLFYIGFEKVNTTKDVAKNIVDAALKQDKMFRYWASSHGGVYVKVDQRTQPNENLAHIPNRDVITKDVNLTLMNPAFMLRQMMYEYEGLYGLKGHITSLKTLNSKYNAPDEWERKVLQKSEKTKDEAVIYEFVKENDKRYLKAFAPMVTEKSCLKCHAFQGYKEGDIRGGVSMTLPFDPLWEDCVNYIIRITFIIALLYVVGIYFIRFYYKKILRKIKEEALLHKALEKSEKYFKTVVNTSKNIILVNDDKSKEIESANEVFFEFTGYKSLEKFKEKYQCICDLFINKRGYLQKTVDDIYWLDYIFKNPQIIHKAALLKEKEEHIFTVNASKFILEGKIKFAVAFNDVTELVKKEETLLIQSKMAAMGEMLENIAHQWRQPLSVITTGASGIKIQKEYGTLNDDLMVTTLDEIIKSAEHLSDTIDDFRDFFKTDKTKHVFNLKNTFNRCFELLSSKFKNRNIEVISRLEDIEVFGYENEMIQAFMNILNNAKDALEATDQPLKLIFVIIERNNNKAVITFKDNAGGIENENIDKIFEERFTTKESTGGTGIGLYMTKQIIKKIDGEITAYNQEYKYQDKTMYGAVFEIGLNL